MEHFALMSFKIMSLVSGGKQFFSGVSNAFHSPGLTPRSMDSACFHKLAVLFEVYLAETNLVSKIYLAISGKH